MKTHKFPATGSQSSRFVGGGLVRPEGDTPTVQLLVTIDTECDKGPKWRVRQPLRFSNILKGIPDRLQPLFDAHNIKPTYLLSPEVIADAECAALFRSLAGRVDLGTHLHAEFIGPEADLASSNTSAVQCDLPPELEFEKLANLTRLFEERIGHRPTAFRSGRFGIGPHTLDALEKLGYRVDSSVTPNRWWWIERGRGVNFLGAPVQPYHPSQTDFRRPGDRKILEAPVTVLHPVWDRLPDTVLRALRPLSRYQTVLLNMLRANERKCRWLRPTYSDAASMIDIANDTAARSRAEPAVLCMMFHSNEATAGASPYFETEDQVNAFLETLSSFFERLDASHNVISLGLSDLGPAR